MNSFKRSALLVLTLLLFATPSLAEENAVKSIFQDVFYGGLSGGLVGAAILAFTKHPSDHLDFIGYGAAGGALVGVTYGAVAATRSLAEVENGKVKFSMPTIIPGLKETPSGQSSIVATTELVRAVWPKKASSPKNSPASM